MTLTELAVTQDEINQLVDQKIQEHFQSIFFPKLKIYLFPGGKMPKRATDGAVGFDFYLRAIVSAYHMNPDNPILRKTIFNFKDVPKDDPPTEEHVVLYPDKTGETFAYRLDPGENILVGVGCVVEMGFPMFHWVAPRSGLATKWNITVTNAPGTVDPDYRGEAGVLVKSISQRPIMLTKDMKIAQGIFQMAIIPTFEEVHKHEELSKTVRSAQGFGSTGIR